MASLLRRRGVFLRTVDFCQYGVPWRKRTYFNFWGVPESSIELKVCHPTRNRCSCTGKRHVVLSGVDSS
eukprot:6254288-Alexandrium_andersonii.AAC.1